MGSTVDQPEFDLTLATNYQSSNLVGLISSTQIEGFGDLVGSGSSGVVGGNLTVNGYVYSNQRTTTGGYRLPDWQIYNTSTGSLSFYDSTNTAERFQDHINGRVGIGTINPTERLHVKVEELDSNQMMILIKKILVLGVPLIIQQEVLLDMILLTMP